MHEVVVAAAMAAQGAQRAQRGQRARQRAARQRRRARQGLRRTHLFVTLAVWPLPLQGIMNSRGLISLDLKDQDNRSWRTMGVKQQLT
jgi:hypothetical protein